MLRAVYSLLLCVALPAVLLRLAWRGVANRGYWHGVTERLGRVVVRGLETPLIWVHAVSVGEAQAAVPLVRELLKRYPQYRILITTTTPTGRERVVQHFGAEVRVSVQFAPYDLPLLVGHFLDRAHPQLLVIMETEIWPNLLAACARRQVPVVLANARLSARSARRYAWISGLIKPALNCFDAIAAQTEADRGRFEALGAEVLLTVTGSIKFDVQMPASVHERGRAMRFRWGADRGVLIAASTHEGEEESVLNAFAQLRETRPDCLLVLVPRHPERFGKVEQIVRRHGFNVRRHSEAPAVTAAVDVYLGDTMGELTVLYAGSDVAFVGGSWVDIGGHNMLEPAALGIPSLFGPYLRNFADIARALCDAGAAFVVDGPAELAERAAALLADANERHAMGEHASSFVGANRGALERTASLLAARLPAAGAPAR